ncbi:ornithine cyclodeaminase family protein [Candidatus Poribacteria bacterium]|nr:ornithine cyclodeaminase family protein [Candidatus Poribacteria bacterium]
MELLYLSRSDVERVGMSMAEIIDAVEEAFLEKGRGRVEMPPKPGIHPRKDAFIHAMPAYIPSLEAAGIKWVSGYPENHKRGLPYITGLIILNDPETGVPMAVMDASWITAMRTGAATAVAAKYLARKSPKAVAIIGCGVQGRTNLEALKVVFPSIETVYVHDILPEAMERYADEMSERFGVEVIKCAEPEDAVRDADIVVTATPILKEPQPVIRAEWLKPGVFACPLDFDSYFKPEAFSAMDRLYTDDLEQQRYYVSVGYFKQVPEPHGDLGEVVAGSKPARQSDDERIMSINLGLAIEDMATAIRIYHRATEMGIGQRLEL